MKPLRATKINSRGGGRPSRGYLGNFDLNTRDLAEFRARYEADRARRGVPPEGLRPVNGVKALVDSRRVPIRTRIADMMPPLGNGVAVVNHNQQGSNQ